MTRQEKTDEINRCALLVVACNAIMQDVCDTLSRTAVYRQQTKKLINQLTQETERFMATLYQGIGQEEEMQYYALVRTVESGIHLLTTCTPTEIEKLTNLLQSYRAGKVEITPDEDQQL